MGSITLFTDIRGINNRGQIVGRYLTPNPDPSDVGNPLLNHGFICHAWTWAEEQIPAFGVKTTIIFQTPYGGQRTLIGWTTVLQNGGGNCT